MNYQEKVAKAKREGKRWCHYRIMVQHTTCSHFTKDEIDVSQYANTRQDARTIIKAGGQLFHHKVWIEQLVYMGEELDYVRVVR